MKTQIPFLKGLASLCLLLTLMSHSLLAQTTVTIDAGINWTDVMLYKNNQNSSIANTNYYNQARNMASAWTVSGGYTTFWRTLFKFNLSSIPSGAVIQSATLYLYSDPSSTGNSGRLTTN